VLWVLRELETGGYIMRESGKPSPLGELKLFGDRDVVHAAGLVIAGTPGDDVLTGTADDDSINGFDGADIIHGLGGNDRLFGGNQDDQLFGGDGKDLLLGGDGADILRGGLGNDRLRGEAGDDELFGDDGNDTLLGEAGADQLNGGGGRDTLTGGADNDIIDGGAGRDTAVFSGDFSEYSLSFAGGVLTVIGPDGTDTLTNVEQLQFDDQLIVLRLTGSNAPVFTSGATASVAENQTAAYTAAATDADGGAALVYSLTGTDAALFDIDSATGIVTFKSAPDFETPGDAGGDNIYDISVRAFDGANTSDQAVAITVTDVLGQTVIDLTTLSSSEGFIIQGDAAGDYAGYSVSSAGDINGDGYDDLIVGARGGDDGGSSAGEAYVIFGSASGFGVDVGGRQVIDLTSLSSSEGFIIQGDEASDAAGRSVSSAGDVNGDGYDDLIVGAFGASEAYVVFGSTSGFGVDVSGRQVMDLTSLSLSQGFIIQGDEAGDQAGFSVSSAGDINGDGYDDLIVGARIGDDGGTWAGEAYVVYGSASGFGSDVSGRQVIDLTTLSASQGFIIQGDEAGDFAGWSVSSAGDINGDGYDDLMVGAPYGDDGGTKAGETYVLFGSASGFGVDVSGRQVLDLTSLSSSQGFIIQGDEAFDTAGRSVSSAGDVNGDGYDDLIVAAHYGYDGGAYAGEAYVIFGSATGFGVDVGGRQVIDLTSLSASQGFIIQGDAASDYAGYSVSSAGDINGDGYDDLIVGATGGDDGGTDAGEAYVIFGSAAGFGVDVGGRQVLDLTSLSSSQGFIIQGDEAYAYAGVSVSSAGDVNGDGYDDLIVGARAYYGDGGSFAGESYVVFGSATGSTAGLTASGTAGANAIIGSAGDDTLVGEGGADVIRGGAGDDVIGVSDAGFFRIDGGGGSDTLRLDGSGIDLDFTAIAQNTVTGIERIDLTGSGDNTLTLTALDVFDMVEARESGVAILRVDGDIGDTVNLIAGAWVSAGSIVEDTISYDRYTLGNAEVRISAEITVDLVPVFTSAATANAAENQTSAYTAVATDPGATLVYSLSGTDAALFDIDQDTGAVTFKVAPDYETPGDGNGDNVYDVVVTVTDGALSANQAVAITVTDVFEAAAVIDLSTLTASEGFIIQGDAAYDRAGRSVSNAGDINGDGYDDMIVGAFGGDDGGTYAGEAYVVFGSASGFGVDVAGRQVIDLTSLSAAEGFIIQGDTANDYSGWSVSSAGDINGDGYDDMIVGAPRGDDGGSLAGEAYVVFGSASGFGTDVGGRQVIDLTTLSSSEGFIIQGDATGDYAGTSVSSAGDVNGDGYDDLIVGAYRGDDGGSYAGEAYVVFGTASGFGVDVSGRQVIDLTSLSVAEGFIIQGDVAGDQAGRSVSSAGDINGDGFDDLIVGSSRSSAAGYEAGEVFVVFGSAGGFGTADGAGRQVIDVASLTAAEGFVILGDDEYDLTGSSVSSAGDVNGDGYDDLIISSFAAYGSGPSRYSAYGESYVVFGSANGFGSDVGGRQVIDLTDLTAAEGFIISGAQSGDLAGALSVSSAGDVNGDGYDDLIVGAVGGDDGGYSAGEAYVVFGTANGFGSDVAGRQVMDLAQFTETQGFLIQGDAVFDKAGTSVASAGDINGDGYDDLIVGALYGDDGGNYAGEAYVVFGSATGSTTGLTASGTAGANAIIGSAGNDTLTGAGGADVIRGGAGDDVIGVSDAGFQRIDGGGGSDTLRLDGSGIDLDFTAIAQNTVTGIERIDLTGSGDNSLTLTALDVFDMVEARSGGVAILRVNGDAGDTVDFSDSGWTSIGQVTEGAVTYNRYTNGNAEVRVEAGVSASGVPAPVIDLTTLSSSEGFIIQGDAAGDYAGWSVSSAGDVNGDGFDDLIVGAIGGDDGGSYAGEAYVVFGSGSGFGSDVGGRQVIDLTTLSPSQGFIIQGDAAYDFAGVSVSSAGDINGDGYDDLIVGAVRGDDGGVDAGEVYVVFGSASGFGSDVSGRQVIDLTSLTAAEGFIIQGDEADDLAGASVSSAGDINGDGYDDLIVGSQSGSDGGTFAGEAYVVFGSASGFGTADGAGRQVIDLTSLTAAEGFIIQGDAAYDRAGYSVSSAGDVNGDGYDDLIVGAPSGDDGGVDAGEVYVVFGSASGFGSDVSGRQVIDLTTLSSSEGFIIQGDEADDFVGSSVSSAGDINGDGYDDLIVGGAFFYDPAHSTNEAYVVFGSANGFGSDVGGRQVIDLTSLTAAEGFIIQSDTDFDVTGRSVSSAGDVNGDGYEDLIVGAPRGNDGGSYAGGAYVIFGSASGFGSDVGGRQVLDLATLSSSEGFIIQGDAAGDYAGASVSSAGDVNSDGFDDLIVGARLGDDGGSFAGEAYVVFGSATGSTTGLTASGTAGANAIIGSAGDDTLVGAGGADVIRGGAGDDVIGVSDATFARIDGGGGSDTLRLDGAGIALDFTAIAQNTVTGIERIDLTGSGDNSLTLTALDVFDMVEARSGGVAILRVNGDAGDTVTLTGGAWVSAGTIVEDSVTYDRFTLGNAEVRVETAITVSAAAPLDPVKIGGGDTAVMDVLDGSFGPELVGADQSAIGIAPDLGLVSRDARGMLTLSDVDHVVDLGAAASLPGFVSLDGAGIAAPSLGEAITEALHDDVLIRLDLREHEYGTGFHNDRGWALLSDVANDFGPVAAESGKGAPVMEVLDTAEVADVMDVLDVKAAVGLVLAVSAEEPVFVSDMADDASGWM
jgi:Ca2+-binding RTX toxin-like protein